MFGSIINVLKDKWAMYSIASAFLTAVSISSAHENTPWLATSIPGISRGLILSFFKVSTIKIPVFSS